MKILFISLFVFLFSGVINAGVIVSPVSVINNDFGVFSPIYSQDNMINQSTLSTGFVSGVTDFNTYALGNPTANCNNCSPYYFGQSGILTGNIDFDLGSIFSINQFGLWNGSFRGITAVEIFTSLAADFATSTSVGTFNPTFSGDANLDESLQVFDLIDTNAQYVRLNISNFATNILGIAGVAFDVNSSVTVVPEPASLALMGLGLVGLGFTRRRKSKALSA